MELSKEIHAMNAKLRGKFYADPSRFLYLKIKGEFHEINGLKQQVFQSIGRLEIAID